MMALFTSILVHFILFASAFAIPWPQDSSVSATSTEAISAPVPTACGDLIRAAEADSIVNAVDVYNCWATVPFVSAVATRFIKYWNDTLQFQSTLDYLKSPPPGYQKPAVDLVAGLQRIQDTIDNGGYKGEYEFEADVQRLLYSANDAHVNLDAGLLSSFSFGSQWGLTSISLDGVALPKVYLTYDLYLNQSKGAQDSWQPSAISKINGTDAIEYLSHFAALNSLGTLEPHADWNTLMDSPVLDVLQQTSVWDGAATFYPGDQFSYTFENGSVLDDEWLAVYYNDGGTGPLETGGDYYNFFVLGFYPASYNPNDTTVDDDASTTTMDDTPVTSLSYYTDAYPENADVYQDNLGTTGFVTGYFFPDISLAVLSIPTFYADGADIQSFSDTVQNFLTQSKANGLQKVLVDLQQNAGGDLILAYNTFKQFFPAIEPFAGSVMRAHPLADTLGEAITAYYDSLTPADDNYVVAVSDEWTATSRLNAATGRNFTSWAEFFGPNPNAASVTLAERLNTTSYIFDYAALGDEDPPEALFQKAPTNPFAPSDIVILSDALCSSACSLFMEMMRHDAGVKNVVTGGRPNYGPMQTPSGSRGARYYDFSELDDDINNTVAIQNSSADVPNRNDQSIFINSGGVSLRAQVLQGDDQTPLLMQYEAADCRIFLIPDTFNNFTNLWQYASDAIWTTPSYCVQDSTGYATTGATSIPITSSVPLVSIPNGVSYDLNGLLSFAGPSIPFISSSDNEPLPDSLGTNLLPTRPAYMTNSFKGNTGTSSFGPGRGGQHLKHEEQVIRKSISKLHTGTRPPRPRRRTRRSLPPSK